MVMSYESSERLQQSSQHVTYGSNWFDGQVFNPGTEDSTASCIGWVGRLEEAKDPSLAVATFSELKKAGHSFKAWMAGSGSLEEDIVQQLDQNCLAENVDSSDYRAKELADRLRQSSALLITSRTEGMPRAALEALACGTPVVTTRCGDLSRVISSANGRLVSSRDEAELARQIVDVEGSIPRSKVASSVRDYEMREVLNRLFGLLEGQRQ